MSSLSPIFDLRSFTNELRSVSPFSISGEVQDVRGSSITARLSGVAIGDLVEIVSDSETTTPCNILDVNQKNLAFVVAVSKTKAILSPLKSSEGILPGDKIVSSANPLRIHVSAHLLGTVVGFEAQWTEYPISLRFLLVSDALEVEEIKITQLTKAT